MDHKSKASAPHLADGVRRTPPAGLHGVGPTLLVHGATGNRTAAAATPSSGASRWFEPSFPDIRAGGGAWLVSRATKSEDQFYLFNTAFVLGACI